MKKLFLSLVAMMVATISYSQSSMLATLSHDGEISTFYGASALRDAYAASENGDIITLSSGSFSAVKIEKALTIRGAGMAIDSTAQTEPTVLMGDFTINIPDSISGRLTIEGIYHNHTVTVNGIFSNGTFLKDRFNSIKSNSNSIVKNLTMIHCVVSEKIELANNSSVSCVNGIVVSPRCNNSNNFEFVNCVIITDFYREDYIGKSSFKNCILHSTRGETTDGWSECHLSSTAVAYNCVGIGNYAVFKHIPNTTNKLKIFQEVFKTYTGTFNDNESFSLTDEARTSLLGIDGTQIGIYGGNMPFSSSPTNPQITKCNVAAKSTADGKLSVDIIVNGAE